VADLLTKALNGNQLHCLLKKLIGWKKLRNDEVFSSIEVVTEDVCWNGLEWRPTYGTSQTDHDDRTDDHEWAQLTGKNDCEPGYLEFHTSQKYYVLVLS
jgi:hypothetical protein